MLRRVVALVGLVALSLSIITLTSTSASASGGTYCDGSGNCFLVIDSPPSDPVSSPDENGWTPGPSECLGRTNKENIAAHGIGAGDVRVLDIGNGTVTWFVSMACGDGSRHWSNNRQCYVSLQPDPWPAPPPGYSAEAGYYSCLVPPYIDNLNNDRKAFWSNDVPPGLTALTPARAAAKLIATFQLRGVDVGMAPQVNPEWGHRRGYVGVPIWLWVDNPQPLTWGPYTETGTLGGQTITATAQVTSVIWQMGDGGQAVCGNLGTPYTTGYGITESPTCGYRYTKTSSRQADDRYAVTATSQWSVTWTSTRGAAGTIPVTTTSAPVGLEINELQTVTVPKSK